MRPVVALGIEGRGRRGRVPRPRQPRHPGRLAVGPGDHRRRPGATDVAGIANLRRSTTTCGGAAAPVGGGLPQPGRGRGHHRGRPAGRGRPRGRRPAGRRPGHEAGEHPDPRRPGPVGRQGRGSSWPPPGSRGARCSSTAGPASDAPAPWSAPTWSTRARLGGGAAVRRNLAVGPPSLEQLAFVVGMERGRHRRSRARWSPPSAGCSTPPAASGRYVG